MKIFTSILFLVLIAAGCEYKPDEIYNRKVNQNVTAPNIQVVELNLEADTIYAYGNFNIRFKFNTDDQAIRGVEFIIDGNKVGSVQSDTGKFYLPCEYLETGVHDLMIRVYTATGSGSLAEELGVESFVGSQSWKLVLLEGGYYPQMTSAAEDGLLHIRWTPYKASNLKEFVISRRNDRFEAVVLARTSRNEFIDSSFVGEGGYYDINVITDDNIHYVANQLYVQPDIPQISFSTEYPNRNLVKWTRSKYYRAIDTLIVFQGLIEEYPNHQVEKRITNQADTSYEVTGAAFGDELYFNLHMVPKKTNIRYENSDFYWFESHTTGFLGFQFEDIGFDNSMVKSGENEFIYYGCDKITRYSLSTREIKEEYSWSSQNCSGCWNSVYCSNTAKFLANYMHCDGHLVFMRFDNFKGNQFRTFKPTTLSYDNYALADNGMAIVQNLNGGFNLYDMVSNNDMGHFDTGFPYDWSVKLKISPDAGHFLIITDSLKMIRISGTTFTRKWKLKYNTDRIKFFEFNPLNPDQIIFWQDSKLLVKSCDDQSVIASIPFTDDGIMNIDYENREILSYVKDHLFVRSLDDGSLKTDIPVHFDPSHWSNACLLINHAIIYSHGLIYFIQ